MSFPMKPRSFMAWKRYIAPVRGIKVQGDKKAPPTRWWNHLWLVLFGWKTVVVFTGSVPIKLGLTCGFKVGYRDFHGRAYISTGSVKAEGFKMLIGHEDCTFFAVTSDTLEEIELVNAARVARNHPGWKHLPLL